MVCLNIVTGFGIFKLNYAPSITKLFDDDILPK